MDSLNPRYLWPELFTEISPKLANLVARNFLDVVGDPVASSKEDVRQLVTLVRGKITPRQFETYMRDISESAMSVRHRKGLQPGLIGELDRKVSVAARLILFNFISSELALELIVNNEYAFVMGGGLDTDSTM